MCRPAQISIGIMNDGPGKIRRWSQRIKHHQVVLLSARSALCCSRARRRSVPKVRAHRFSVCLQQAGTNQHRNNERWSRKNTALVPSDQAPSYYDFRGGGPLFLLARDPQLRFTQRPNVGVVPMTLNKPYRCCPRIAAALPTAPNWQRQRCAARRPRRRQVARGGEGAS